MTTPHTKPVNRIQVTIAQLDGVILDHLIVEGKNHETVEQLSNRLVSHIEHGNFEDVI